MTSKKSRGFSQYASLAALLLMPLTFNLAAQAQDGSDRSAASAPAPSIWSVVKTPNIQAVGAISADSEDDIWAVPTIGSPTVSLHFDGTKWNSVPMANASRMDGVAVLSPTDVWAVGEQPNFVFSVIQHFNGTKWTVVPSPHFKSGEALNAVQAISADDIFAVGSFVDERFHNHNPLVEHFDGTQWRVVPTPPLAGGQSAELNSIAIISALDIWVVGGGFGSSHPGPLVMHFDGKQWSQVTVPGNGSLNGVTALSTDDVWAVGNQSAVGSSVESTLIEHWDGADWDVVPSLNVSNLNSLSSVAAISSTDVWATGCAFCSDTPAGQAPLIEHWNGTRWTISPAPSSGLGSVGNSVLAFPSGSVFVGGVAGVIGGVESVILHTTKGR
jgi:hypothetical protein